MHKLYYISQGATPEQHIKHIRNVCESGVRMVQLRLKNITQETYNNKAIEAKEVCRIHNATLIINDNIEAALKSKADGVHLGKNDSSPLKARDILKDKIIGGTANTIEDCVRLIDQNVQYIGLGPYGFTTTKKNLSPVLGASGYQNILDQLKAAGHNIPVYAIGGVEVSHLEELKDTGVFGVAASGLLTKNKNLTDRVNKILDLL